MTDEIRKVKEALEEISKKINKLEDDDPDYGKNLKWHEMQAVRDKLYEKLRELEEKEKHAVYDK